jgi:hypothetical protein
LNISALILNPKIKLNENVRIFCDSRMEERENVALKQHFSCKMLGMCDIFTIFAPKIQCLWTHYSENMTGYWLIRRWKLKNWNHEQRTKIHTAI